MDRRKTAGLALATAVSFSGCTTIPAFVVRPDAAQIKGSDKTVSAAAPAGPKVAALVANLKCGLWKAATSRKTLPYYVDDIDHLRTQNAVSDIGLTKLNDGQVYNLRNIFGEIEYVAAVQFTLDVIDTSAFNPAAILSRPLQATSGLLPATSELLAVGSVLSEAPHRFVTFNQAIDFARLAPPGPGAPRLLPFEGETHPTKNLPKPDGIDDGKCGANGAELEGDLGLEEALATGIIAASMSDISVFSEDPDEQNAKQPDKSKHQDEAKQLSGGAPAQPPPEPIEPSPNNVFGVISVQIDFTIVENINGGPNWTLTHFKGPAAGSQPLLSLNRQVKDTLAITFLPVCIRRLPSSINPITHRRDYSNPDLVDGTPDWARYLPTCGAGIGGEKAKAAATGQNINNLLLFNSVLQALPR
ncbi:hypothetical protein ACMX25_12300 [Caballeronia sp. 15715]|uniref:hypothetical protein n=1 Tax=Caballeronia sp. 15715 TaxID=3391030 RepID=UPI0039E2B482